MGRLTLRRLLFACGCALLCVLGTVGCSPKAPSGGTGGTSGGQTAAGDEVVVGFVGPLSGDAASYGASQKKGIELAADEINAGGGMGGRKVRVVYEDSQMDQSRAVTALNKLVDSDHAQIVLGESSSAVTIAMGPVAERKGVLLVSPIASASNVTKSGFRIFRIAPADDLQARVAADFVQSKGWKTCAVLFTTDDWGKGLSEAFSAAFQRGGGTIACSAGVKPKVSDLKTELARIKQANPDVVYMPLHPDEAIVALKQARQQGLSVPFVGADGFSEPTIIKAVPEAAEGVMYTVPATGQGKTFDSFAAAYRERFREEPNVNAAMAYDALRVIADAASRAKDVTPDSLAEALRGTTAYEGATGRISFDANGDVTSKAYDIMRVESGKPAVVEAGVVAK